MKVWQQSKYGVLGFGHFTDVEMTKLSTFIDISFLREILEKMEEISPYAVLTLGVAPKGSEKGYPPIIHLSFVNCKEGWVETEGLLLPPRSPMLPYTDGELMIDKFLDKNADWFDEFPGYEPMDGICMEEGT